MSSGLCRALDSCRFNARAKHRFVCVAHERGLAALICGKSILGVQYCLAGKEVVLMHNAPARSAGTTSSPFRSIQWEEPSEIGAHLTCTA